MKNFKGIIPSDVENLKRIEGVGPYTAGAISSIAYGQVEPLVDGNVIRVLSRLYALKEYAGTSPMEKTSWSIAKKLVDLEHPGDFNQGLMELGATVCSPTSPNCDNCPLRDMCKARIIIEYSKDKNLNEKNINEENSHITVEKTLKGKRKINPIILQHELIENENENKSESAENLDSRGYPLSISYFPQKIKKKRVKEINILVKVFVRNVDENNNEKINVKNDKFLFIRRPSKGLLANQWEFPSVISEEDRGSIESGADFHVYLKSLSLFMKNTMGVNWNINDDNFNTKSNAIHNIKQTGDIHDNQNITVKSGKKTIKNLQKKSTENDENDTFEKSEKSENNHDIAIDNNKEVILSEINQNLELIGLSSIVILTPIEHIFSHQKHFMNIYYSRFKINDNDNNNNDDDVNDNINVKKDKKNKSKTVHGNCNDLSWTSLCGQNREIKWMNAQEITEAGITTGCKKILTEVLKQKPT
jgi:adenine-specific DNA glycosylase